jgi:arylsulfatase A-like enzyme
MAGALVLALWQLACPQPAEPEHADSRRSADSARPDPLAAAPVSPSEIPERVAALGRPNLVLVVVDTLRADFTTPYGFVPSTTPELADWAARGVLFERARSQSSWTKMSMASLFTSLWPRSHGIRGTQDGLAAEAVTLPEVLQDAGYSTYGVQTNGWLHQSFGFHQGFDRYMFPKGGGDPRLGKPSLWPHADRVVEQATELLARHDRDRPFFLYLHFMDVHEFAAPPEFRHYGQDTRGAYLAAIRWVDNALARVRRELSAAGLLERTLMVFTSDHGETFGEHGVHGHARNVLTPVVWVPLVLRLPFVIDPPVRVSTQVRGVDVAPTLLALAGLAVPSSFEGASLVPLITGAFADDRPSFAALGEPLFPDASVQVALNDGSWTYARNATASEDESGRFAGRAVRPGAEFLFDRSVDPGENVNLMQLEPVQAGRMSERVDEHMAGAPRGIVDRDIQIDPSIADRLRALGYLQSDPSSLVDVE